MNTATATFYVRRGKRWFDALASGGGFLVLLPILILLALATLALQGRPLFFAQRRIGRQGKVFTLWKLRTMKPRESEDSNITVGGDHRVTPWGRLLRRFKVDELPQLWCVLKGDMSLVGPRPDVEGYWDRVREADRDLLELLPGITSPASLVFRHEERLLAESGDPTRFNDDLLFPEKVRLSRRYAKDVTFLSDLKWILLTFAPEGWLTKQLDKEGWSSPLLASRPSTAPSSKVVG